MKIGARLANWLLRDEIAKINARYEAAFWGLSRSYLPGYVQSARDDINTMSRREILRRVRYFEKNSPVMLKVLGILDINVVGSGITPSPATADMGWNKEALAWWSDWMLVADVTGQSTISALQSIAYRAKNVDGDSFIDLTSTPSGRPAIDLIEAHRVGSAGVDTQALERAGFKVFDGVIVDKTGRPVAYLVANDFDSSIIRTVPAGQFVPNFSKKRAGQYRGITLFHAAILDLHDLDDLQKYEMRAAKDAASISKTIQTAAGGITVDGNAIGASLTKQTNTAPGQRDAYYKQALGGETIVTYPGDKYEQFKNERPSAATTGFWEKLDNKIVQGSGVSYAALVDYNGNWGGATLRAAVTSDNRLYELNTIEQANAWQRVWEHAIGWAIQHGEISPNPDWRKVRWHPPRRTTVDVGHESASMLNELKAGAQTYQGIFGEQGEDWRERLEQRAIEEAFINELATKYTIPRELIASFAQERLTGQANDAAPVAGAPAPKPGAKK